MESACDRFTNSILVVTMKHLLLLILACISFSVYGQVNPNYHKVDGYYRDNGTRVEPHYRTDPNKTINDNYTTKPNVNPHNGKKGTISQQPASPNYSSPTYKAPSYPQPKYNDAQAPSYKAPSYPVPSYKTPSYSTPPYKFK
jgi:hypothetical protein